MKNNSELEKYYSVNKSYWDESVDIHTRSEFYELEEFLNGRREFDLIV